MELLKKLLENLGINEETFKSTFAIIIEAGERLKRIEEKLDEIIKRLDNQPSNHPQSDFEKQDENGELVSVKFDDAIENLDLQQNTVTDIDNGLNPNIGKS